MTSTKGVIVTGMHRSGTSLTTMLIARLGYQVSSNLMKARKPNPRGNFEDTALNVFHDKVLVAAGTSWNDVRGLRRTIRTGDLPVAESLKAEARELISGYEQFESGKWLWKNPRSTLLLPMWATVAPEAVFVGVIRRPPDVVASFLRRKDRFGNPLANSLTRFAASMSLWISYNTALLRFAEDHPDRLVIMDVPADIELMTEAAGDDAPSDVPTYEPDLLRGGTPWMETAARLYPEAARLYDRLKAKADPLRLTAALVSGPE